MRVVKTIIVLLVAMILVVVLSVVGFYFFVLGFSRGTQLFQVLMKTSNANRSAFYNNFVPQKAQTKLLDFTFDIYKTYGVVIDVDKDKKWVGVLSAGGYKRFTKNDLGLDVTKYRPRCTQPEVTSVIGMFRNWIDKIHKGDFVHVEYLAEDSKKVVVPTFYSSYTENVPYWDNVLPLCLK